MFVWNALKRGELFYIPIHPLIHAANCYTRIESLFEFSWLSHGYDSQQGRTELYCSWQPKDLQRQH